MLPGSIPPGTKLDRYRVMSELGRGGMGVVLKATEEGLDRVVAIKVLPRDVVADPKRLERFRREAKGAAAVTHPNITTLYTFGEANGWPFMVFEFMAGGSLQDRLRQGPVPWREAVKLMAPVARALGAIHAAGLVHRDLKPANILIDAAGRPKLGDFGLVRREEKGNSMTGVGELVGTAAYLSPEQAGDARVDHRADLYAFGATLYALLTGSPPFTGEGLQVITKHLTAKPPPPSEEVETIPKAVDRIVLRLLEKKPEARGAGGDALADELEALLATPSERVPTIEAKPSAGPGSRSRAPFAAGAAVVVVALAGAGALLLRGGETKTGAGPSPPPVVSRTLKVVIDEPRPGAVVPQGVPVAVRGHVEGLPGGVWLKVNKTGNDGASFERSFELEGDGEQKFPIEVEGSDGSTGRAVASVVARMPLWFTDLRAEARPKKLPRFLHPTTRGRYVLNRPGTPPMDLVYVPVDPESPAFQMGQDLGANPANNLPVHDHYLPCGYWIGTFEVTWAQFEAFCKATSAKPEDYPRHPEWWNELKTPERHPVVGVSWNRAKEFCSWLGVRLPMEAEWELAARGADGRKYPWGETWDGTHFGNFNDQCCTAAKSPQEERRAQDVNDHYPFTAPVGLFEQDLSPWGCFDMAGNVAELCEDWYNEKIYAKWRKGGRRAQMLAPEPEEGAERLRVVRGGCWSDPTWSMCGAQRGRRHTVPDFSSAVMGFRVALSDE